MLGLGKGDDGLRVNAQRCCSGYRAAVLDFVEDEFCAADFHFRCDHHGEFLSIVTDPKPEPASVLRDDTQGGLRFDAEGVHVTERTDVEALAVVGDEVHSAVGIARVDGERLGSIQGEWLGADVVE